MKLRAATHGGERRSWHVKGRKILIACGIAASALYIAIDFLAAIRHPSYHSFSSQMISELMATGAPTERLVDPLFLTYGVLMLAFAAGLWLSDARRRSRVTAAILFGYAAIGFLGPTVFEMGMRGSGAARADRLHIALTMVLVLLILSAVWTGTRL